MQKVALVTGGAGFIGSHVAHHLIEMEYQVVLLDDLSGGAKENIPKGAIFYEGSIKNDQLITELFNKYHFDYVYHLAAYAAEGLSHFIRKFNYENNLIGSINLINTAVNFNVKCFVFTSSIAVYGTNDLPLKESQKPNPEDPYGIAKYAVEMDLKAANELFGLNSIIFRPHNVYGKNQNVNDKYRNVIGIFMNQILQNKAVTIFGDGEQTRAFSSIDDVAPYIANAVTNEKAYNQTFNIGGKTPYSVKNIASLTMKAMQKNVEFNYLEKRNEVIHAYADHQKFEAVFQPKPQKKLEIGLKEMADWVKEQKLSKEALFQGIEIEKNLPNSWRNNH